MSADRNRIHLARLLNVDGLFFIGTNQAGPLFGVVWGRSTSPNAHLVDGGKCAPPNCEERGHDGAQR
jgi:hypothetical protein